MILPDINVWISFVSTRHEGHRSSTGWLASVPVGETIAFCTITQLGLLRLLSTPSVMQDEVMTQRQAWQTYEALLRDERIKLVAEPSGISEQLKRLSARDEASPKRWVDDYLAAFAYTSGAGLVTFDRALAQRVTGSGLLTYQQQP